MPRAFALLPLLLLFLVALPSPARAQIEDEDFGFTFTVPEGFTEVDSGEDGTTLYTFVDSNPSEEAPAAVIQLQRLHGLVNPNQRLSEAEVPEDLADSVSLEEREWQGLTLDVMVLSMDTPGGAVMTYVIQFPLADEAVQLVVGGPVDRQEELAATFDASLEGFANTQPLYEGSEEEDGEEGAEEGDE